MAGRWAAGTMRSTTTPAAVSRVVIGLAAVFYAFQHFLHPANAPGVPLQKVMPDWIPGKAGDVPVDVQFILPVEFLMPEKK